MSWIKEFGEEYEVPEEISSALYDASWHNDSAPRFWRKEDPATKPGPAEWPTYDLWVEHPDPDKREMGGKRFTVVKWSTSAPDTNREHEVIIETDDAAEALKTILAQPEEWLPVEESKTARYGSSAKDVVARILGEDCAEYKTMKKRVAEYIDAADKAHHDGNDRAAAAQINGAIAYLRAFTTPESHRSRNSIKLDKDGHVVL